MSRQLLYELYGDYQCKQNPPPQKNTFELPPYRIHWPFPADSLALPLSLFLRTIGFVLPSPIKSISAPQQCEVPHFTPPAAMIKRTQDTLV